MRWLWIVGIVVAVAATLVVAVVLIGGGTHGPSRHTLPSMGEVTAWSRS